MRIACVATAVFLALPAAADAGAYEVSFCGQYARPSFHTSWESSNQDGIFNHCGTGQQGFGAKLPRGQNVAPGARITWTFDPPGGMRIVGLRMYRTATASGGETGPQRAYRLYHHEPDEARILDRCVVRNEQDPCYTLGDPTQPFSHRNLFQWSGSTDRLIAAAECLGQNPCEPDPPEGRPGSFEIYHAAIALADDAAPVITSAPQGTLTQPGVIGGTRSVTYAATDSGGGVAQPLLRIDGVDHAPAAAEVMCHAPYVAIVPCQTQVAGATATIDTTRLTDGEHQVQLVVVDAAGNQSAPSAPWTVSVRNNDTPNGDGASRSAKITAAFTTRRGARRSYTVGYGRTPVIEGTLINDQGQPIRGATVDVVSQVLRPGATARPQGGVLTDDQGRFRYQVKRGASRTIQLSYRAFAFDPTPAVNAGLRLTVRAAVRLSIRPRTVRNAGSIRFRGQLRGGPGQKGTAVVIYVADPGGRGRIPVTTVRADRRGRFSARYRFRRTVSTARFRFYARYQRQSGYPYASASSRKISVKVSP